MSRHSAEQLVAPLVAGLVVLVTLLALIGTAIRDPRPHDIAVGVVGPAPAVTSLTGALASKLPGVFDFTTYDSEDAARAAIDARSIDGAVVIGPSPKIIVAGAAGDAITGVITAVFGSALAAEGGPVPVEVVHPFAAGDAHGLVLFFLLLAMLISTLVVQIVLFVRAPRSGLIVWLGVTTAWAVLAGAVGTLVADWIAGGAYDTSALLPMAGVLALASMAGGAFIGGSARLMGAGGIGLSALIIVLLNLISSGGPAGSQFLPDAYRWMSPWMPAPHVYSALRGLLYFDGQGVATPLLVLLGWLVVGLVLAAIGSAVRRPAATAVTAPAH